MSNGLAATDTLPIGKVAEETGISAETLRVWERRYGQPEPDRRESGHRRYTLGQVDWLRRVARALELGHRPSQVLHLPEAELLALVEEQRAEPVASGHITRLVAHLVGADPEAFVRDLVADGECRTPYSFAKETVLPLALEVDALHEQGALSARRAQHARALIADVVRTYQQRLFVDAEGPRVLATTLDSARQGFPLQLGVMTTMSRGIFASIGPDVSTGQVPDVADGGGYDVVGARIEEPQDAALRARALREALPDRIRLVVGGARPLGLQDWPDGVDCVNGVDEWIVWLHRLTHGI